MSGIIWGVTSSVQTVIIKQIIEVLDNPRDEFIKSN
jgi:hypothetical protein